MRGARDIWHVSDYEANGAQALEGRKRHAVAMECVVPLPASINVVGARPRAGTLVCATYAFMGNGTDTHIHTLTDMPMALEILQKGYNGSLYSVQCSW